MPVMDGFMLTREIRWEEQALSTARLPVIAITASALASERDQCRLAGMDDFLAKPVELQGLQRVVEKWLAEG